MLQEWIPVNHSLSLNVSQIIGASWETALISSDHGEVLSWILGSYIAVSVSVAFLVVRVHSDWRFCTDEHDRLGLIGSAIRFGVRTLVDDYLLSCHQVLNLFSILDLDHLLQVLIVLYLVKNG